MSVTVRYALYGMLFGLVFPIGGLVLCVHFWTDTNAAGGIAGFVRWAHSAQPLLWVIDSAPLFLGLFAALAGRHHGRVLELNASLSSQVADKTESLRLALKQAQKANRLISHMAEHDTLTGLLNRRAFHVELRTALERAQRYDHRMAIAFIDLDRFKSINDTYGHEAGDCYLGAVAAAFEQIVRRTDRLARWGGDEFVVLLNETDCRGAEVFAARVCHVLGKTRVELADAVVAPAASIGIAVFPDHARDADELVRCADAAMYQAKRRGGDCWSLCADLPAPVPETANVASQGA
jgi:diguanylate cyclase (GGDEF)-like protein